jgi:hypothetical protein
VHGGDGVQTVEDQVDPLVVGRRRGGERRLVTPVRAVGPDERRLVEIEVGVRDEAGVEQVRVDAAGDRRGYDLPDDVLGQRAADAAERPAVVNLSRCDAGKA